MKRLKNKIILEIILGVLLVAVVAFSGCIEEETPAKPLETTPAWEDSESYAYTTETIVISGMDEVIEINRDNPIKLVISHSSLARLILSLFAIIVPAVPAPSINNFFISPIFSLKLSWISQGFRLFVVTSIIV